MKLRTSVVSLISLLLVVSLSGCISAMTKPSNLSGSDAKKAPTQSERMAAQGCAVGAIGAGTMTLLANIGKSDAGKRAAIAGMLGCIAGSVVGHTIGQRTEQYASARQAAEAETRRNRENRQSLERYNAKLRVNIRDYEKQIGMINDARYETAQRNKDLQRSKKVIAEQRGKAEQTLAEIDTELTEAKAQFASHKSGINQAETAAWEVEIAGLQTEREILSNHVVTLSAMDNSL